MGLNQFNNWGEQLQQFLADGIEEVSITQAKQWQDKQQAVMIDVREDREWAESRIVGAVHMGRGVIESMAMQMLPDRDQNIVLYCRSGKRSIAAAASLHAIGYTNVSSMTGGIDAWSAAGLPTDS